MGAGGCVGILEGVSLQCDRVTLWTFGGTEITFWGGPILTMGGEGQLKQMGRYGSPLAMVEEAVGDYKIGEWLEMGWRRKIRTKGERYERERE